MRKPSDAKNRNSLLRTQEIVKLPIYIFGNRTTVRHGRSDLRNSLKWIPASLQVEDLIRQKGMRRNERIQDGIFRYVPMEPRVPMGYPLRGVRKVTDIVLRVPSAEFDTLYANRDSPRLLPGTCCRYCCCRCSSPYGAAARRATWLHPAVPLVCGSGHGRCEVEPCGALEKSRLTAELRSDTALLCRGELAGENIHVR